MKKRIGWTLGVGLIALGGSIAWIILTTDSLLSFGQPRRGVEGEAPSGFARGGGDASPYNVQPAAIFGGSSPQGLPTFSDLAAKVSPAVVNISTTKKPKRAAPPQGFRQFGPNDPFDQFFDQFFEGPTERPQRSLGSGFIISQDGYIITNNHVVEGADQVQAQLTDKRKFDAKVIGADPKTDLAVIKISATNLPFAPLGNSDQLKVGDWVMAVGNPFGLEHTVTAGIVSAKGRVIGAGPYDDFIQTDASINPGNSGGPLFNLQGEVIGVNAAIVAAAQGIGFAIPINMAKDLVPQLIKSGKVTRAWLGVGIQDITPELAQSFNLKEPKGALVSNVFPTSPAGKGGVQAGDIVVEFDGHPINESHELPTLVARTPVGKKVAMQVLREGKVQELTITLGEMEAGEKEATRETSTSSKELGLAVRDLTPEEMTEAGVKQGILIIGVEAGSPADFAGCQRGDILLALNNTKLIKAADFQTAAKKIKQGQIVRLHLKRDDQTIFLAFTK